MVNPFVGVGGQVHHFSMASRRRLWQIGVEAPPATSLLWASAAHLPQFGSADLLA
jgi:hypothetical protein